MTFLKIPVYNIWSKGLEKRTGTRLSLVIAFEVKRTEWTEWKT